MEAWVPLARSHLLSSRRFGRGGGRSGGVWYGSSGQFGVLCVDSSAGGACSGHIGLLGSECLIAWWSVGSPVMFRSRDVCGSPLSCAVGQIGGNPERNILSVDVAVMQRDNCFQCFLFVFYFLFAPLFFCSSLMSFVSLMGKG
jgi:hypothetical protein